MGRKDSNNTIEMDADSVVEESLDTEDGFEVDGRDHHTGPLDEWEGRVLGGRYLLKERIGAGSNGQVYRGQDVILREPIAVKIVSIADSPFDVTERSRF